MKDLMKDLDLSMEGALKEALWLADGSVKILWERARGAAGLLRKKDLTVAVAESLTGGWVSAALTSIPGISQFFMAGIVAYANEAKMDLLGVPALILEQHGAVSPECAQAMASGVRLRSGADIGVATTGVAGPTGGSEEKPVGLMYVSVDDGENGLTVRRLFSGDRSDVTFASAEAALEQLEFFLSQKL
ncbi:MAG: CinA family protein [Deltaproteobacteria bacterium]|jgi:PncC family amidohydrolase|nr:CinA family protein [Deltaproteobacteria bacterium]